MSRIKRVMQDVQGTGQVPKSVCEDMALIVGMFVDDVVDKAVQAAPKSDTGLVTLDEHMIRAVVEREKSFDFLRTIRVAPQPANYAPRGAKRQRKGEKDSSDSADKKMNEELDSQMDKNRFDTGTYQLQSSTLPMGLETKDGQNDRSSDEDSDYD